MGSIDALRDIGGWTEDSPALRPFSCVELGKHGGRGISPAP